LAVIFPPQNNTAHLENKPMRRAILWARASLPCFLAAQSSSHLPPCLVSPSPSLPFPSSPNVAFFPSLGIQGFLLIGWKTVVETSYLYHPFPAPFLGLHHSHSLKSPSFRLYLSDLSDIPSPPISQSSHQFPRSVTTSPQTIINAEGWSRA
jgi:hypothetical protein